MDAAHLFAVAEVARRKGSASESLRLYLLCAEAAEAEHAAAVDQALLATGLGESLLALQKYGHAASYLENAWQLRGERGDSDLAMAPLLISLAASLRRCGDASGAATACRLAHDACFEDQGPAHPSTISARNSLAECLEASGDLGGAAEVFRCAADALDGQASHAAANGANAETVNAIRGRCGVALYMLGEMQLKHSPSESETNSLLAVAAAAAAACEEGASGDSVEGSAQTVSAATEEKARAARAAAAAATAPAEAASQNLARALFTLDKCLGKQHAMAGNAASLLAAAHRRTGRWADALQLMMRVTDSTVAELSDTHPSAVAMRVTCCDLLTKLGRHEEAVQGLSELSTKVRDNHGPGHPMLPQLLAALSLARRHAGDAAGAQAALRDAAAAKKAQQAGERGASGTAAWMTAQRVASRAVSSAQLGAAAKGAEEREKSARKATEGDLL